MLIWQNALHTLIRQRHPTPSCGDGKAYPQIAEEFAISYKMVANTCCSQLKAKLGARTLQELARGAIEYMARASSAGRAPRLHLTSPERGCRPE
jgi:hypothetical protein